MTKRCIITQDEVEAEKLAWIPKDKAGRNLMNANDYVRRRLRECGITFGREKWKKICDRKGIIAKCDMLLCKPTAKLGKCVWIAEEKGT